MKSSRWQNFLLLSWSLEIELDLYFYSSIIFNHEAKEKKKNKNTYTPKRNKKFSNRFIHLSVLYELFNTDFTDFQKMSRFDNGLHG